MFEVFEHTADLGLRIRAADLNTLFAEAGRGLFSLIVSDLESIQPIDSVSLSVTGNEIDYLLFDWLNELLYSFETTQMLLIQFDVQVTETGLTATARGEKFDRSRHRSEHEVKAITYHELKVMQDNHEWLVEVIVDI